jgi:hypothetical protein
MALNTRMIPVGVTGGTTSGYAGPGDIGGVASRRYYSCSPGSTVDVPGPPDGDAAALTSQGFAVVAMSGTTGSRPTTAGFLKPGMLYIDTTLSLTLCWDGVVWRNALTGAAA